MGFIHSAVPCKLSPVRDFFFFSLNLSNPSPASLPSPLLLCSRCKYAEKGSLVQERLFVLQERGSKRKNKTTQAAKRWGNIDTALAKTPEGFAGQNKVPLPDPGPSDHNLVKNPVGHQQSNVTTMGCKWKWQHWGVLLGSFSCSLCTGGFK